MVNNLTLVISQLLDRRGFLRSSKVHGALKAYSTHLHLTLFLSVLNPGLSLALWIYQQREARCLGNDNAVLD